MTRRAILAATLELVAEIGISDFRVEDVAVRAGVGKSAIHRVIAYDPDSADRLGNRRATVVTADVAMVPA